MKTILISIILTTSLILSFFIFSNSIPFEKGDTMFPVADGSNVPIGEIKSAMKVGQMFVSDSNQLNRIDVLFGTYARVNTGDIVFHLREKPTSVDITTIKINAIYLQDNKMYSFKFEPIPDSKGKQYYFFIESPNSTKENAVTVWILRNSNYTNGKLFFNDNPTTGDMVFRSYYETTLKAYTDELFSRILLNKPSYLNEYLLYGFGVLYVFLTFVIVISLFKLLLKSNSKIPD
jgi:hypothetical protein